MSETRPPEKSFWICACNILKVVRSTVFRELIHFSLDFISGLLEIHVIMSTELKLSYAFFILDFVNYMYV